MDEMRQQLDAIRQSRAGAREIRVGIDGKDAPFANRRQIAPAFGERFPLAFGRGSGSVVTARHHHNHLRT